MSSKAIFEAKMQKCIDRLGIPLKVLWVSKETSMKHGEISSNCILIYDREEAEAWLTFEHEVYEYKFKEVTAPYLALINSYIDAFQKLAYDRKEKFIESIPEISKIISIEKKV
jgi:hypothetical protein